MDKDEGTLERDFGRDDEEGEQEEESEKNIQSRGEAGVVTTRQRNVAN
jgi:hypothetical protein